jgi:hypothetical protein
LGSPIEYEISILLKLNLELQLMYLVLEFKFNLFKWQLKFTDYKNQHAYFTKLYVGPFTFGAAWDKNPEN